MLAPHFIENIFRSRLTLISSWDGFCHEDQWNVFDKTFLQNVLQYYWNEKRTYHVFKWWLKVFYSFSLSSILMCFYSCNADIYFCLIHVSILCWVYWCRLYSILVLCTIGDYLPNTRKYKEIQGNTRKYKGANHMTGWGGSYSSTSFSHKLVPIYILHELGNQRCPSYSIVTPAVYPHFVLNDYLAIFPYKST